MLIFCGLVSSWALGNTEIFTIFCFFKLRTPLIDKIINRLIYSCSPKEHQASLLLTSCCNHSIKDSQNCDKNPRYLVSSPKTTCSFLILEVLLVHSFPNQCRPCHAFLCGACVDLVHLRHAGGARTDQVHGFVLMSHFPDYQPLKGDHRWFVVLHEQQ